ncbi:hypothetical protein ABPG77_002809 [Micractinium sp. CCAP 211/92]
MPLLSNGILANEVLRWKAIGAASWLAVVAVAADACWSLVLSPAALMSPLRLLASVFSPAAWLAATALLLAQAPAFAAQGASLTTREPRPRLPYRLLPWPRLSGLAAALGKLAARTNSVMGAARVAAFYGLHAVSAVLCLSLFSPSHGAASPGASWNLLYGLCLAAAFLLHWARWSLDVPLFPTVQRHRYFRIKQRLPGAAAQAARLALLGFALAAGVALARARTSGAALVAPLSLGSALVALLAGSLCAFCWLMAGATLEVVFTERLRPDDYSERDVLAAMAASLAGRRGDLMQGLALHDASLLASDVGKAALRRADIFADESGDRWKPVAAVCISELDTLSAAAAAAAAQQKPAGAAAGAASGAASGATQSRKWNALPSAVASKGGLAGSEAQIEALLQLRCAYPRAVLAANALAGFACASLQEDRFGILQLTQPCLGDVLLCLLSALGAAQQLVRSSASLAPRQISLGPWRGNGDATVGSHSSPPLDAAAVALADVLTVALYRVAATFGDGLTKLLADSKARPAFGSIGDAAALLQLFLKGQA